MPTPAYDPHAADDQEPVEDLDQASQDPFTGPSIAPSTAAAPERTVRAGQPRRAMSRSAFDNPPVSTPKVWKPTKDPHAPHRDHHGTRRGPEPRSITAYSWGNDL